jgi:hypothetical protein
VFIYELFCFKNIDDMKNLVAILAGISVSILVFVAYRAGHFAAAREIVYVYTDAPVFEVKHDFDTGEVASSYSLVTSPPPSPYERKTQDLLETQSISPAKTLFEEIGIYRSNKSLPEISYDLRLCEWVDERLNQLVSKGSLDDHTGFKDATSAFLGKGYMRLAENIGQGFSDNKALLAMWYDSLSHRSILESIEYPKGCAKTRSGFGVFIVGG